MKQQQLENDLWKQKYENHLQQMVHMKANYELEIKSLSQELSRLHYIVQNQEVIAARSFSDKQYVSDSQNRDFINSLKQSQVSQSEMYEQQLNKLRNIIEDMNVQIHDLQTRLERSKCEKDSLQQKLKTEIEQLHLKLSEVESLHQDEVSGLRQKYEFYTQTQFRNTYDAHLNQMDLMAQDCDKLKQLIEIKNTEIETLIQQGQMQRIQFEEENDYLRRDISELKERLSHQDFLHQQELKDAEQQIESRFSSQIVNIKQQNTQLIQNLTNENESLRRLLESKKQDNDRLLQERSKSKILHEEEVSRLMADVDQQRQKNDLKEQERQRDMSDLVLRIEKLNQTHQENELQAQSIVEQMEKEINNLHALLEQKQSDQNQIREEFNERSRQVERVVYDLRDENEMLKIKLIEYESIKHSQNDEFHQQVLYFKDKLRQSDNNNNQLQEQCTKLKEQLMHKQKEIDLILSQKYLIEAQIQKVKDDNDKLLEKLNDFEHYKNMQLEEIRMKMEQSGQYQIDNLKTAYNTQISILQSEITKLQSQLTMKQRDYIDMLDSYQNLERSMQVEMLGKSRLNSDLATSKAICDSVVRSHSKQYRY